MLESDKYIERTVQELYQAVGIASSFGTGCRSAQKDPRRVESYPEVQRFIDQHPLRQPSRRKTGWIHDFARGCTNLYREMLYVSRRGRRSNRATLQSFRGLNTVRTV